MGVTKTHVLWRPESLGFWLNFFAFPKPETNKAIPACRYWPCTMISKPKINQI